MLANPDMRSMLIAVSLVAVVGCVHKSESIMAERVPSRGCLVPWVPCDGSEDSNGDGLQNAGEDWTDICSTDRSCIPCIVGKCVTLVFVRDPAAARVGRPLDPIYVELRAPNGAAVTADNGDVTLRLVSGSATGTASGQLVATPSSGLATFDDVRIDRVGQGYTLIAEHGAAAPAASATFDVVRSCPNGMTAYWPLGDANGGVVVDELGNNDGACTTCPTFDATEAGLRFNGTDTAVDVPGGAGVPFNWAAGQPFSVELWFRAAPAACTTGTQVMAGREDPNVANDYHWWVGCDAMARNTAVRFRSGVDTGIKLLGPPPGTGTWHHLVGSNDAAAGRVNMFVDGVMVASIAKSFTAFDDPVDMPLNIGWLDRGGGYSFNGFIANVAIYDRALGQGDVTLHYDDGRQASYCDVALPVCGNGVVEAGEECDDSNGVGGDGCSAKCRTEPANCPSGMHTYLRFDGEDAYRFEDAVGDHHADCSYDYAVICPAADAGVIDGGQTFDGATTGLAITASTADFDWSASDSFTVELWTRGIAGVNCAGGAGAGNQVWIGRRTSGASYWWFGCHNSAGVAHFQIRGETDSAESLYGPPVNDGAWHHVAAVRDGSASTVALYFDGALADEIAAPLAGGLVAPGDPLHIGWFYSGYNYAGTLDAIAVYNRVLSASEISAHFAGGAGVDYCAP